MNGTNSFSYIELLLHDILPFVIITTHVTYHIIILSE